MKKIMIVFMVFIFVLSSTGCSKRKSEYDYVNELNNVIVEALKNEDKELFKSIFSNKALDRAPDIDEGIDLVFELYKGNFVEIVDKNHSSTTHFGEPGYKKNISGWFYIKTTENVYKISYDYYPVDKSDTSNVGVYNLGFSEYEDNQQDLIDFTIAGISTPKRYCMYLILSNILTAMNENNVELIKKNFSERSLNVNFDQKVDKIFDLYHRDFVWAWLKDGWYSVNSDGRHVVYQELLFSNGDYIMYFDIVDNIECKINTLKFTKIDEEKDDDYELKIHSDETGVIIE